MHSSRLSPCCQSDRVQGPPSSPCQIPGQSGQHGPAVQPPVLKEVPSRWPGVCSGWGTVLGSRPVTRTAARLQGQSWARPDVIGSSCLLQHLPVPTEPTSQVQTRESDCFLNPRMRAWKEGCGVKRTGTRFSVSLNPISASSKDGLFPALLGEDGAWLVLGIWVVC